jgi:hypothetical protein
LTNQSSSQNHLNSAKSILHSRTGRALAIGVAVAAVFGMSYGAAVNPALAEPVQAPGTPGVGQVLERPDKTAAIAAAMETNQRVRITSLTSETSEFFALPSGEVEASVAAGPVRTRRGNDWVPVDLTLQKTADGSVVPAAHPIGLTLSGARTGPGALASLGVGTDAVRMRWSATLPEPVIEGNKATYSEVLPGIDMVVEATRTGFEQFVVVKTPSAVPHVKSLSFLLTGTGVGSVTEDSTGSLEVKNPAGKTVGSVPTPLMWDAQLAPNGETPARTAEVDTAVQKPAPSAGLRSSARTAETATGSVTIQLSPDEAWLTDPKTKYPVTIDPQISKLASTFDTTVMEGSSADQGGADYLRLGVTTAAAPKKARSFVHWDTTELQGMHITSARTYFYNWYSTTCAKTSWEIWSTEAADSGTRWANQPKWLTKEASSTETKGFSASCDDGWVSIDSRNFFQRAASADRTRGYMGVRATDEADKTQWKEFRSRNADDTGQVPYSTITYKNGDTDFGVTAGDAFTVGVELDGAEVEAKLAAMGYTQTAVVQAMDSATPVKAAGVTEALGTPEDSQMDPTDDTLFNQAWADMADGSESPTPPPVVPDAPASGRDSGGYTAVPAEPGDTSGPISASSSNPYGRVSGWREKRGVYTTLRNGVYVINANGTTGGHNLEKIDRKHNLTMRVLKNVTKHPQYWSHISGKKWHYTSYPVHHMKCWWSGIIRRCKSVEVTTVLAAIDFRTLKDGYNFGFPTAYCTTYVGRCPNWVRNSLN